MLLSATDLWNALARVICAPFVTMLSLPVQILIKSRVRAAVMRVTRN